MNKNPLLRYWYINGVFGTTETNALKELSPLSHATCLSYPVLLLTAQHDFHLNRDANDLCEALEKAGTKVERKKIDGKTHHSIVKHMGTGKPRDTITPIWLDFVDQIAAR